MPEKTDYLKEAVSHIDVSLYNVVPLVRAMRHTAGTSWQLAETAELYDQMLCDHQCAVVLCLGGPLNVAGLKKVFTDMVGFHMVDAIVDAGAEVVGQDFFESLGFSHYKAADPHAELPDEKTLHGLEIVRRHDVLVDESERASCDETIRTIAAGTPGCSSRELVLRMGRHLEGLENRPADSLLLAASKQGVPIFCPALGEISGVEIDTEKDFQELVQLKAHAGRTGLLTVGDSPDGFVQQLAAAAVAHGLSLPAYEYAVGIKTAHPCGPSGWSPSPPNREQCVLAPANLAVPLVVGYAYHLAHWLGRDERNYNRLLDGEPDAGGEPAG